MRPNTRTNERKREQNKNRHNSQARCFPPLSLSPFHPPPLCLSLVQHLLCSECTKREAKLLHMLQNMNETQFQCIWRFIFHSRKL